MEVNSPCSLLFHTPANVDIMVKLTEVILKKEAEEVIECRLILMLDGETYKFIDENEFFHLEQGARGPMFGEGFRPEAEIELEVRLSDVWLLLLTIFAETEEEIIAYLIERSKNEPNNLLFGTESWYGLYVKQEMDLPPFLAAMGSIKTGYSTKWVKQVE